VPKISIASIVLPFNQKPIGCRTEFGALIAASIDKLLLSTEPTTYWIVEALKEWRDRRSSESIGGPGGMIDAGSVVARTLPAAR